MKKVFIGVIAALMLFAFTACEQPGLTLPANVDYITVVQTKDFVAGDKFNAANFTVYAHDTNGGNTPVSGVQITAVNEENTTVTTVDAGNTYTATATLKVATSEKDLTASCTFTAFALESYSISGMPSLVAYVDTKENQDRYVRAVPADYTAKLDSVKVSAVYENGDTREKNFADISDDLYVTDAERKLITAEDFVVDSTYYLSVWTPGDDYDANAAYLTDVTVKAVAEAPAAPVAKFAGYELEFTGEAWVGEDAVWNLYETYTANGTTVKNPTAVLSSEDVAESWDDCGFAVISVDDGDSSNNAANNDAYSSTYTLFEQSVKIISKTEPSKGVYTIEIPRGENYITALPARDDVHFDSKVTTLSGNMTASQLAIEVEWAKNRTENGTDPEYLSSGYSIISQNYNSTSGTWTALISVALDNVKIEDAPFTVGSDEVLLEVSLDKEDILSN